MMWKRQKLRVLHTSAATVAVLPEMDDVEVDLNPNDVRVDVYRSSGNGGQSVNTTDSAVKFLRAISYRREYRLRRALYRRVFGTSLKPYPFSKATLRLPCR